MIGDYASGVDEEDERFQSQTIYVAWTDFLEIQGF
jgi:hypothetical protein